jgi:hypothetical protein
LITFCAIGILPLDKLEGFNPDGLGTRRAPLDTRLDFAAMPIGAVRFTAAGDLFSLFEFDDAADERGLCILVALIGFKSVTEKALRKVSDLKRFLNSIQTFK